jgi:hypothetical protein
MKPSMKLAFVVLALVLALGSVPASAIPSACQYKCFYPDTCFTDCADGETWTTCYAYFGGSCDPW